MRATFQGQTLPGPSPVDGLDYARRNHTFEHFAMYDYWRKNVSGDGFEAREMAVGLTPAEYFETLGINPIKGRLFTADENTFGKHFVAVISTGFWHDRFNDDPHVLGRTLRINDEPYTVVGVVPDIIPLWMAMLRGAPAQVWTPFAPYANFFAESTRGDRGVYNIGRLKPGVTLEQAQTELNVIAQQLAAQYPVDKGAGVKLMRLADDRSGPLRSTLWLLISAVALILLIACSNVANLILMRNSGRQREFALRAALGGARIALIRPLLVESALLALMGGAAGVVLARFCETLMLQMRPARLPQLASAAIDSRVLVFTVVVSNGTTLLFGLWPALASTRVNLVDALKDAAPSSTASPARLRMRRLLVVSEVAFSLMLLIGAGLLLRSISRLYSQEMGFASDHLLRAHLYLPPARYRDSTMLTRFADTFADRVRALPGVREASITTLVPPSNNWNQEFSLPGQPVSESEHLPSVNFGVVDEHFLSTFGIPLLRGRNFKPSDTEQMPPVALVNETLVRRFFPNQDPIGLQVRLGHPGTNPVAGSAVASAELTIVGVVGDTRNQGLANPIEPQLIALYRQMAPLNFGFKELIVRTSVAPQALTRSIADELHGMDPDIPLAEVETVDQMVTDQTSDRRFTTALLGLFATLGLVLAVVGAYGVIAQLAVERTREIGLRIALGAQPRDILWLVTRPAIAMALSGAVLGLGGAVFARHLVASMVFGISAADPGTFVVSAFLLLIAVVAASVIPAWKASRADPMMSLRCE
jgi:predicted permease